MLLSLSGVTGPPPTENLDGKAYHASPRQFTTGDRRLCMIPNKPLHSLALGGAVTKVTIPFPFPPLPLLVWSADHVVPCPRPSPDGAVMNALSFDNYIGLAWDRVALPTPRRTAHKVGREEQRTVEESTRTPLWVWPETLTPAVALWSQSPQRSNT